MSLVSDACSGAAFESRYQADPDPWNFATSAYERGRYRALVKALPRASYVRALEPGCSVGELTAQLAAICGHVVAADVAPSAVARARQRCATLDNVEVLCADIAAGIPPGEFDLIVFSEIGYYFESPRLVDIALKLSAQLSDGGDFVAVHWLGESKDHVLHGDEVHETLLAHLPLQWLRGERHESFRIDLWRRT